MDKCFLCDSGAVINRQEGASRTIYNCMKCGVYVISDLVEKEAKNRVDEIESYLMTRKLAKKDADTVLISFEKANLDKDYLQLTVQQIVNLFPETFSEQMDMALRNLGYMSKFPGYEVNIDNMKMAPVFYVRGENQVALLYLIKALRQAGLIDYRPHDTSGFPFGVTIAPKGWEKLENSKFTGTRKNLFAYSLAQGNKFNAPFCETLEKIAQECGYHSVNNSKVPAVSNISLDIASEVKSGELIVCDFSEDSGIGYYLAATAHSLGKTCVLTCHESSKKNLKFDTSQYHIIFWDKSETLYIELLSAIKALI